MIDSGASSTIMPRCVADQLGLKYDPLTKHVLQLDGTSVTIVGVIKGLKMALHACLGCTMIQDISMVELPTHFSLSLSRDFTAQLGGYIASVWSYMFFKTRYGTKASIKAEPLSEFYIETYTPSPINKDCISKEEDEGYMSHEHATSLVEVPDLLLDESANSVF